MELAMLHTRPKPLRTSKQLGQFGVFLAREYDESKDEMIAPPTVCVDALRILISLVRLIASQIQGSGRPTHRRQSRVLVLTTANDPKD